MQSQSVGEVVHSLRTPPDQGTKSNLSCRELDFRDNLVVPMGQSEIPVRSYK